MAPAAKGRVPQSGGPGTTTIIYYSTYAPVGTCHTGVLTIMLGSTGSFPAPIPPAQLSFAAGEGPPLVVSNCHFSTPQYVKVTLGTPSAGAPYIRQTDYTVNVDSASAGQVTGTWTACGSSSTCATPGLTASVNFNIGDPSGGGGL